MTVAAASRATAAKAQIIKRFMGTSVPLPIVLSVEPLQGSTAVSPNMDSVDSTLTINAEIHDAVMALPPDERRDRAKVNEAVREVSSLARCGRPVAQTCTAFRRRRNRTDQVFGAGTIFGLAGSRICTGPPCILVVT